MTKRDDQNAERPETPSPGSARILHLAPAHDTAPSPAAAPFTSLELHEACQQQAAHSPDKVDWQGIANRLGVSGKSGNEIFAQLLLLPYEARARVSRDYWQDVLLAICGATEHARSAGIPEMLVAQAVLDFFPGIRTSFMAMQAEMGDSNLMAFLGTLGEPPAAAH